MNDKARYMFLWREKLLAETISRCTESALVTEKTKPGVRAGGWGRGRAPTGTGPALPHTDVSLPACRNPAALWPGRRWGCGLHKGWQDVASACAAADVYSSRYPSGSGVRQAAPGDVVRSKAFPWPGLPVRRQRASHGSAGLVTVSVPSLGVPAGRAFLGSAVGKQPEDRAAGAADATGVYRLSQRVDEGVKLPRAAQSLPTACGEGPSAPGPAVPPALPRQCSLCPCRAPLPALSLPVCRGCKAIRLKPIRMLSELSLK